MQKFIDLASQANLLRIIDDPLDVQLEIPHISYIEVKKPHAKALLFTQPKRGKQTFSTPVLTNIFGSSELLNLIVGKEVQSIAEQIQNLLKLSPPKSFLEKLTKAREVFALRHAFPKILSSKGECQEVIDLTPSLFSLPVLKTWEKDGGAFITMGQVYTQNLEGQIKNLGMYRLQVLNQTHLALHWQIHKDSNHFFHEYKKAGVKMPVSIALGGDPLYTWCGQAPMPYGAFELMLYGLIRSKKVQLVKSITNPIMIPSDVDFVIEGWVDPSKLELEGPFGDHTGYYTPIEPYPVLEVSAITSKRSPIFPATVVGKPPLEDKYMGYLTERVFLPMLKTTAHGLLDYHMPENGVFHNLILAQIAPNYPAHSQQIMHAFWGVGQMSFVKHAIFVDAQSPKLTDYANLTTHILNRFDPKKLLITEGICDALDHSSPQYAQGGKLGVDASGDEVKNENLILLDNEKLLKEIQKLMPQAKRLRQYFTHTTHPITILGVKKDSHSLLPSLRALASLCNHLSILIAVDEEKNDLDNTYMLVWRITNNIDAKRDILILDDLVCIDATDKGICDGYTREWPLETDCSPEVIQSLKERGIIDVSEEFLHHFHICNSSTTKKS